MNLRTIELSLLAIKQAFPKTGDSSPFLSFFYKYFGTCHDFQIFNTF